MSSATTYNHLDLRVCGAHRIKHGSVRVDDGLDVVLADVDVVGAEHELDNVGLGVLDPADDIIPGNIIRLPARVAFVIGIKTRRPRALSLEVVHAADEVDIVRQPGRRELVPYQGSPAGDLSDGVAKQHCFSSKSGMSASSSGLSSR